MSEVRPALVELTIVRTKEFIRETEAVFWVFAFPLALAVALGFAFREKAPDRVPIGIEAGPHAQERLAALQKSPALLPRILPPDQARLSLSRGKISLLVEERAEVVFRFDPSRPDSRAARMEADDAIQRAAGRGDPLAVRDEKVSEIGSRYIDFLIPGLLGMNLMGTGMWGMGFSIVNARMRKLLKRLVATPMRKSEYLISQFLSRLVFLVLEVTILLGFARLAFGVRVNGSFVLLGVVCLLGGSAFAGLGLLTASRARTIEAASGIMNLVMIPMWLCSGVFFSYERFPERVKPLIRLLPLTALNDALRGVMGDALTLSQIASQLIVLTLWSAVSFVIALRIFRWQ
ncbi:MAG TPA: ABC transporter permease [Thermoanaerobaculia bacterium]|nr:ABC transporter permease [Thermoanaerobaculia bacterium]